MTVASEKHLRKNSISFPFLFVLVSNGGMLPLMFPSSVVSLRISVLGFFLQQWKKQKLMMRKIYSGYYAFIMI